MISVKISDFGTSRALEDVTKTSVGTPLFAAPELCREDEYDEKVDVYSFGMLLMAMCTTEELPGFVGERWRAHFGKKKVPNPKTLAFMSVLNPAVWVDGWRPVTIEHPIDGAPSSVVALIVQCCAHNPAERPSFKQILTDLSSGAIASEIEGSLGPNAFSRKRAVQLESATSPELAVTQDLDASSEGYPEEMRRASEARLAGDTGTPNPMRTSRASTPSVTSSELQAF